MATGYLVEYRSALIVNGMVTPVPKGMPLRTQVVSFTTSTQFTNPIGGDCGLVGLWSSVDANFEGGANPTASSSTPPLTAKQYFFFGPDPSGVTKIALVAQS